MGFSRLCLEILRAIDAETISDSWTTGKGVKKRQTIQLFSSPLHLAAQWAYCGLRDFIEQQLLFTRMPVSLVMRTTDERLSTTETRRRPQPPAYFTG